MKPNCPSCGYIHTSTDARAVGRFGRTAGYVAANAETPVRATRAEAEADECAWRRSRLRPGIPVPAPRTQPPAPVVEAEPPAPFPAPLFEVAAREKAWCDFLAQARMSLLVWEVDPDVRRECCNVVDWLRRCRDDLGAMLGGAS